MQRETRRDSDGAGFGVVVARPATTDRSPAPFVHASDEKTELDFRAQYRAFVDAFRAGAQRLHDQARELADLFPLWAFPPALPFNAPT